MVNIQDFDFGDDRYIGEALLALMGFFLYVWITSGASPINFPGRSNVAVLVGHLSVILVAVIPLALLGLVQSLRPSTARAKSTAYAESLAVRAKNYRLAHSTKRYRKTSKDEESEKVK